MKPIGVETSMHFSIASQPMCFPSTEVTVSYYDPVILDNIYLQPTWHEQKCVEKLIWNKVLL